MPKKRDRIVARLLIVVLAACALALAACSGSSAKEQPTPSPKPLPSPVQIAQEPQGIELEDPSFDALPGAKAYYGKLGGTAYRIEMPDNWNGRLILYMHGFQNLAPKAHVENPTIRAYLVRNGYAWGASSFSSTALIPGRAADETAALWDRFVEQFGRPERTYVTGASMGGGGTHISAERYGDRYDGAVAFCGVAGQSPIARFVGDYFFAAAYVAGVSQAEFDAAPADFSGLVNNRIIPALNDSAAHKRWEDILIDLTGGPRAFDVEGFALEELTNWQRASILVPARLSYNDGREYSFSPAAGVSDGDFNRNVIRVKPDEGRVQAFIAGNELSGDLQMPMLTVQTTGDWQVPVDEQQIVRRKVEAAGKADMLVQRAVRAAPHCGFTDAELIASLDAVRGWVERGERPDGEDLMLDDLAQAGAKFTLAPRLGSAEGDAVAGASGRIVLSGSATLDGNPMQSGFVWVEVRKDGLRYFCSYQQLGVSGGRYRLAVAADGELRGCGVPGAQVYLATFAKNRLLYSQEVDWPSASEAQLDAAFSTSAPNPPDMAYTFFYGTVLGPDGRALPPGTRIEAYAGDTLCGATALPAMVMRFSDPDNYAMAVAGPDAIAGCAKDATLTLRVNGKPVSADARNAVDDDSHELNLLVGG